MQSDTNEMYTIMRMLEPEPDLSTVAEIKEWLPATYQHLNEGAEDSSYFMFDPKDFVDGDVLEGLKVLYIALKELETTPGHPKFKLGLVEINVEE